MRIRTAGTNYVILTAAAMAAAWVSARGADEAGRPLTANTTATNLTFSDGPRLVLDYRYREVPFKPYAAQLTTPGGVPILRDSPFDHKHHHGLMFAVAADGVNFWEERPASGKQVHRDFAAIENFQRDGIGATSFSEQLDWSAPGEHKLLQETRKVTIFHGPGLNATLLTWATQLQPADKPEVKLGGSNYFGLGMRFVTSMDKVGQPQWADASNSELVHGDTRLTRSAWVAYTASIDGKPVTAALFDHPSNVRHPARMFNMLTPFAYLSATLDLSKEPLLVAKDRPLAVRYGVAVWDGKVERAQIEALYRRWQALEP